MSNKKYFFNNECECIPEMKSLNIIKLIFLKMDFYLKWRGGRFLYQPPLKERETAQLKIIKTIPWIPSFSFYQRKIRTNLIFQVLCE